MTGRGSSGTPAASEHDVQDGLRDSRAALKLRTALVHDYLLVMRGAERSFAALADLWPNAPIATLLYDEKVFSQRLTGHVVKTSRLQRLRLNQTNFTRALPLMPAAAERLNVAHADLVVSSSSAFAHAVRPGLGATHVCYCYTPFRYAWYERERGIKSAPPFARPMVSLCLSKIRDWDSRVASRPTHYVAISRLSQERILRHWGREAPIVHPPVELERFEPGEPEDFFLVVCELVPHKRVDLALEAAKLARVPIKVVGGGSDHARLRALYGENAEFLGRLGDEELAQLYPRARALVVPNVEEFGIAAVEAQACGRPVVAAGAGGALETIVANETGAFFPQGDVRSLARILADPALADMSSAAACRNAERFSVSQFQRNMLVQVDSARRATH
jgi:glycosyltransferase involved in cell wall biosynthesis